MSSSTPRMPNPRMAKKKQYPKDSLLKAVEAVRSGTMTRCAAAKSFGVPKSTLIDQLNGTAQQIRRGTKERIPRTVLTKEEEDKLVNWVLTCSRRGRGKGKEEICQQVINLVSLRGLYNR